MLVIFSPVHPVAGAIQKGMSSILDRKFAQTGEEAGPSQAERDRLEIFMIQSPQLRVDEREIFVYLPPDYYTGGKYYPVIYFQDGGMVFSTNGSSDSQYDEVLDHLHAEGKIDGIIAVGIRTSENRWDEYSPWVNENMDIWVPWNAEQFEGGEGDAYLDFVINTLKPHIDTNFRTLPDRENTAIGGFSMGGLISIYAGLIYPEVFSMVMAQSPAIWFAESDRAWDSENLLVSLVQSNTAPQDVRFYLDIGTNEWAEQPMPLLATQENELVALNYPYVWLDGVNMVFDALQSRNVPDENLLLVIEEGGIHEHDAWNRRSGAAILWLFGASDPKAESGLIQVMPPERVMLVDTLQSTDVELDETGNESGFTVEVVNPRSYQLVMLMVGFGSLIMGVVLRLLVSRRES